MIFSLYGIRMRKSETRIPGWQYLAFTAIIFLLAVPPYRSPSLTDSSSLDRLRVLFIGNSLTYANDLPGIIQALAEASRQPPLVYQSVAFPDFSLEDHWNRKDAHRALLKSRWDYVVMQQGPSASSEGRALLLDYTRRFAAEIHRAGGKPALYMVWPFASRMQDFKGVSESYRQAAETVDGLVFPVGEAWLIAWRMNPEIKLYSEDGFHPSMAASYLAALVIYEQLYHQLVVGLPAKLKLRSGAKIDILAEEALQLQEAAKEANEKFARR